MLTLLVVTVTVAMGVAAVSKVESTRSRGSLAVASLSVLVGCLAVGLVTDCLAEFATAANAVADDSADAASSSEGTSHEPEQPADPPPTRSESEKSTTAARAASTPAGASDDTDPTSAPEPAKTSSSALEASGAESNGPASAPPRQLLSTSSEPLQTVTNIEYLSKNRPAWLETKPVIEGDQVRVTVKAGPYFRMRQCLADLDDELKAATEDFIAEHLESKRAAQLIRYNIAEIKNRIVRETFEEQLVLSVGPMNQAHALLVFDRPFAQEVEHRWKQIKAMARLLQVGVGSGVVLLLLTTLFGYFRLDTATKGYYTGRLQFMAAAAILALVAASVLLVKWIPWL